MTTKEQSQSPEPAKINRRDFIKLSTGAGAGAAASLIGAGVAKAGVEPQGKDSFSLFREEYNTIDDIYQIASNYQRMDQKNTVFSRGVWDPPFGGPKGLLPSFYAKWFWWIPNPENDGNPGYHPPEHALDLASWAGHDTGAEFSALGIRNLGNSNNWERHINPQSAKRYTNESHKFENPIEAAKIVKRAARFLGASLSGIAPFDERWVYKKWYDFSKVLLEGAPLSATVHEDAVLPFKPKSVISVAFEMPYDAVKTPGYMMDGAAGICYSKMTEVTHKIAVFLNYLGYKAIPCGNDTAMSIPIAAQAGIGELSRMGSLISEKYGSRIRLAKVFTDLDMAPDKPITFGVWEFCKRCKKCAEACPGEAISLDDEPSPISTTGSKSSHPGVTKWFQNNEKCFKIWEKMGCACGICLAVCPYNKLDNWNHDLAKIFTKFPVGRDIARQLDDIFGYGAVVPKNVDKFWKG